jgi:RNA polymerase sigma-70 factor (ECF subfamily)
LIVRLRDLQDTVSWKTFLEVYTPLVYRYCQRQGLKEVDAQDVSQEVFRRVSKKMPTFEYRPEVGRFRAWLGTIVKNEIKRFLKKRSRQVQGSGNTGEDDPLDQVERTEEPDWIEAFQRHVLTVALQRIRPHFEEHTWRMFEEAWCNDRPAAAIAHDRGVPVADVYVAKSRVLARLKEEVRELSGDLPFAGPPHREH